MSKDIKDKKKLLDNVKGEARKIMISRLSEWAKKNPAQARESLKVWAKKNSEAANTILAEWAKKNPVQAHFNMQEWSKNNPKQAREIFQKWARNNPEKIKSWVQSTLKKTKDSSDTKPYMMKNIKNTNRVDTT